ncbi:MAG: type II toxin-antitoxin system VapC family toxin [Brevundimonas sp.]
MRLLLDTNVLLRMLEEPHRLSADVQAALDDLANTLVVTTASLVEISIKVGTGRMVMPPRLLERLSEFDCDILPVKAEHAMRMADLPVIHRDPFDRLIVAQAMSEDLILLTTDRLLEAYGCAVMRA